LLSSSDWVRKARDLLATAELVAPVVAEEWRRKKDIVKGLTQEWPQDHSATYFMLTAFAVENLLKGALVVLRYHEIAADFDSKPSSGKSLPKLLQSHDLMHLVRLVRKSQLRPPYSAPELSLSLEEEDLVRRLTLNAKWYGRYPIAISPRGSGDEKFSDGKVYNLRWFGEQDVEKLKLLVARFREELHSAS
jgi:hypothetical protein